jgi:hypothetical protein
MEGGSKPLKGQIMQLRSGTAVALLTAALAGVSSLALAEGVKITNASSIDIDNLSVSQPDQNKFGEDLLKGAPPRVLDAGKSYVVNALKPGTYDFRSFDEETGKDCIIRKVKVGKASATITETMIDSCKG